MTRAGLAIVILLLAWMLRAFAAGEDALLAGLETDDPAELSAAITAIERAPATPELADVLFAAGRACEDRLHDPARALALYERIVRELPDAGISIAAARRIDQLRDIRGHAREAADLAELTANADQLSPDEIVRRAEALAAAPWPGAAEAALWLADWSCRTSRFAAAQTRYAAVIARWPGTMQARYAARNAASCAVDARDWTLAEQLAQKLPTDGEVDRAVREGILTDIERGRFRDRLYLAAWVGMFAAIAALLASLAEAMLRGGWRRPALRPPIEVLFFAPIAAVIAAASFTTHWAIAPAVLWITIAGLLLAWLSGAALDLARTRGRAVRARSVLHVLACAVGIVSVGYIALVRDGLLDMLEETMRYGPGA